jgi:diguanylate cyclase (GGDEF)-like protein
MLVVLLATAAQDQRRAAIAADFAIVANIARELCRVGNTRGRICRAIYELSGGDLVVLAQPDEHGRFSVTGCAGNPDRAEIQDCPPANPSAQQWPEAIARALIAPDRPGPGLHQLPDGGSVLCEPLDVDGRSVAKLLVEWRDRPRQLSERTTTLISMVAAEGAIALDREELLTKLDWLARRDELTGALNRRVLAEELDRELAVAVRKDRPLCVLMLDIDNFKQHNDTHGHAAGDRLLKAAAAGWTAQLRSTDILARYGGEEFVVVLPECGLGDAVHTADRLRASLPRGVTCSAGAALLSGSEPGSALINRADGALYHAKANGRNRTSTFHSPPISGAPQPDPPRLPRHALLPTSA